MVRKSKDIKEWRQHVIEQGEKTMSESRVAICCLVRDCRKSFGRNIKVIEQLRSKFEQSYFIVVENDSIDGTKDLLKSLECDGPNTFVESFDTGSVTLPKTLNSGVNPSFSCHRVQKMAAYRNRYLKILKERVGLDNVDFVVMIDPDVEKINLDGISHSFGLEKSWDVVHANGRMKYGFIGDRYYDVYAFGEWGDYSKTTEAKLWLNQERLSGVEKGMPLIAVRSGFNALAIYRRECLEGVEYRCATNDDDRVEAICEHVSLHDDINASGFDRICLNPEMYLIYNTRGGAIKILIKKIVRKLLFK